MNLGEKIKRLREVEGELRGIGRPMTQKEIVNVMAEELQEHISQAYLSQLESGKRVHLTASSRDLLARFFKVHPGYLVSDPPDYSTDLLTDVSETNIDRLFTWLMASAEEWQSEPVLGGFLEQLALTEEPRRYLAVFHKLIEMPAEDLEVIVDAITNHDHQGNID